MPAPVWTRAVRAAATADMATRAARPDADPGLLLPQATVAFERGGDGRVSGRHGHPQLPMPEQERFAADSTGHFRCGPPACRPGSGHRGQTSASGVRPADAVLWEPVAASAAAGEMQPAAVDANGPGNQAAAPLGWQPSRFLADRAEAERAFALAEQLGSVNAVAKELGTTWPSLRKAFRRHGLRMPARDPEAVRQRAVAAASQRGGPPAAPPLDPVFVALNPDQLPTRRGAHAEQGVRLCRAEEIETLSYRTVVKLNAESRLALQRRVATIALRPNAPNGSPTSGPAAPTAASSSVPPGPTAATYPQRDPRSEEWRPIPDRPTLPEPTSDQGKARFRADLDAYLDSLPSRTSPTCWAELPSSRYSLVCCWWH
jgi:hypothetical protein